MFYDAPGIGCCAVASQTFFCQARATWGLYILMTVGVYFFRFVYLAEMSFTQKGKSSHYFLAFCKINKGLKKEDQTDLHPCDRQILLGVIVRRLGLNPTKGTLRTS